VGQKVHPFGFRLGIFEDWHAHWFAKKQYGKELLEDIQIREYLKKRLNNVEVSKIVIEKTGESARVVIWTSSPGMVIGKKGQSIEALRVELSAKFGKNVDISVQEIKNQDLDAQIVARSIAEQIEKRVSYKKLMKKAGFAALKSGAKGIKICISGRLAGSEIARSEWLRLGSIPLHTLRANVDYALAEAKTTYGMIGVKVWICKGEH
jgi:small subunit ribosomal protein S3